MTMGDGTACRDYGSYGSWERKQARRRFCEKWTLRLLYVLFFFFLGMETQYFLDSEIRNAARESMTRDIAVIESMPDPTDAQKAEARKRARKVTTKYLSERIPTK
jgi:hypothetical protein